MVVAIPQIAHPDIARPVLLLAMGMYETTKDDHLNPTDPQIVVDLNLSHLAAAIAHHNEVPADQDSEEASLNSKTAIISLVANQVRHQTKALTPITGNPPAHMIQAESITKTIKILIKISKSQ
jgi:hypothetical protein